MSEFHFSFIFSFFSLSFQCKHSIHFAFLRLFLPQCFWSFQLKSISPLGNGTQTSFWMGLPIKQLKIHHLFHISVEIFWSCMCVCMRVWVLWNKNSQNFTHFVNAFWWCYISRITEIENVFRTYVRFLYLRCFK